MELNLQRSKSSAQSDFIPWMPGMLAIRVRPPVFCSEGVDLQRFVGRTYRVLEVRKGTVYCDRESFPVSSPDYAPDPDDPATKGCLLALIRQLRKAPNAFSITKGRGGSWVIVDPDVVPDPDHPFPFIAGYLCGPASSEESALWSTFWVAVRESSSAE